MSVYPKISSTSSLFNSQNIMGAEEGLTTVQLDLSSFIQKSSPVFENPVYIGSSSSLNFQGKVQSSAYDDDEKLDNATNKSKLTNVEFDGIATKVAGSLDLRDSTLLITDETIPINKITDLNDTLVGIQDNLNNITSNDSDILLLQNEDILQKNRLNDLEILTVLHTSEIDSIENDVLSNKVDIASNLASVNVHTTSISDNLTNINLNKTNIISNDAEIVSIQGDIVAVQTDITTNLTTLTDYKVLNDAALVTINDNIGLSEVDIEQHEVLINGIQTQNTAQGLDITAL
jgi:hypothetical protein